MTTNHWPDTKKIEHGYFTLDLAKNAIRNIRYKNSLIIDQLYTSIRPLDWSTLTSDQHIDNIEIIDDVCKIHITDFFFDTLISQTSITIDSSNTLTIDYELRGLADYSVSRWGICFCLNTSDWMGANVTSSTGEYLLPIDIAPQRVEAGATLGLFPPSSEMIFRANDGRALTATSVGRALEAEDQRNWTDNTYKIYSGSLAEPRPFNTSNGSSWKQSITFQVSAPLDENDDISKIQVIEISSLPRIGLQFNEDSLLGEDDLTKAFILLDIDHIRINEESFDPQKILAATRNGLTIEAALFSDNSDLELHEDILEINNMIPAGSRLLIHRQGREVVEFSDLPKNNSLSAFIPGTDAYFVDLHRAQYNFAESVSYSISPTVHTFDTETIFKTLRTQTESVEAAKKNLAPQVFISPITFSTRGNPETGHQKSFRKFYSNSEIALSIRNIEAAAWTLGSIFALAEAGAHAGTWHELFGEFGIVYQHEGAVRFCPVFHALSALAAHHSEGLRLTRSADNSWVAFENRELGRMLLASLRPWDQEISTELLLGYQCIQRLRGEDCERASKIMDWWSYIETKPLTSELSLTLSPFEIVFIKG